MRHSLLTHMTKWEQAMHDKLDSIAQLGTYKLVELPPDHEVINIKWVYCIKHDETGCITCYKARLVTHGFTQKLGVDFDETFAPIARIESIHLLCAIAAALDWEIHVINVNSAFLNSKMPDDQPAYIRQPTGFKAISCMAPTESTVWTQTIWLLLVQKAQIHYHFVLTTKVLQYWTSTCANKFHSDSHSTILQKFID